MRNKKLFLTHKPLEAQNNCTSVESYQNLIRTRRRSPESLSFTPIRKYSQQLITNADRQGANRNRELITFNSGQLSVSVCTLLRDRTSFLRVE